MVREGLPEKTPFGPTLEGRESETRTLRGRVNVRGLANMRAKYEGGGETGVFGNQ